MRSRSLPLLAFVVILLWCAGLSMAEAAPSGPGATAALASIATEIRTEAPVKARTSAGPIARAAAKEVTRLARSTPVRKQQAAAGPTKERNWIKRHPVLTGTLIGFGAGFLIGYLPGNDGVFDDFTAEFSGLVIGGIGALGGATIGWAASR